MDDIVERLRTIIATPHGVDIWTTTALEAADEIERLQGLVAELLPYALEDAEQGIALGPPPEDNEFCKDCDQTCGECKWYLDSVEFMKRYDAGEFSV